MKFVHTYISTKSKVPTLSDIVKAAQTKAAMASEPAITKTASAVAPAEKTANIGNFGDKKAKPFGKKDEKPEDKGEEVEIEVEATVEAPSKAKKKASKDEEGESSGQPEAEAKLVNEPKKPEGDKATGGGKGKGGESDEAESSGQLEVEPLHQKGESTQEKPGGLETQKSAKNRAWIKIANLTSEQKAKMRDELEKFWPKKFVDALLQDR